MSNVNSETELRDSFLQQSRARLMHYAEAHTDNGLKLRLLNLIDDGLIEFNDVEEICKGKPQDCAKTSCNFGLGELDDNGDLVIRDSLYRLYGPRTDENSNSDMLRLLTRMEKMISNPNSAIIFSHHSPKGDQAGKRSIDVAAGGGALGRFVATCITTRIIDEDAKRFSLEFTSRYHRRKDSVGLVMDGPKAGLDNNFNKSELNGNNRYNNQAILNILAAESHTATELQKEVKEQTGMSRSTFYDNYWPAIQELDGVTCIDGKFSYANPDDQISISTTTTATN